MWINAVKASQERGECNFPREKWWEYKTKSCYKDEEETYSWHIWRPEWLDLGSTSVVRWRGRMWNENVKLGNWDLGARRMGWVLRPLGKKGMGYKEWRRGRSQFLFHSFWVWGTLEYLSEIIHCAICVWSSQGRDTVNFVLIRVTMACRGERITLKYKTTMKTKWDSILSILVSIWSCP